ncbi:MAG: sensor domain-containing diguanylate cyclase [Alphaproteobacteria bacterium]|nr:sensor domain-containing diguanylate cyclase [Alphaproteobacteria bacterium]
MIADEKLTDEEARIRALRRYRVLDTETEKPFEKIVGLVEQILNVPICAVSLVDSDRQWFKASRGLEVCETRRDISFCTHAIQTPEPMIVQDAQQDPRFAANPLVTGAPHIRSYAGAPLQTPEGYNVGSLCAIDVKPRAFPDSEIAILSNFANLVVEELELRLAASSDLLTGVLTRRAWRDGAEAEISRARRHDRPMAVALFDIDRFKAINDSFGHPTGDRVIQAVSAACADVLRATQTIGRWGGEEFAILLPECDLSAAATVAERCRQAIEALEIRSDAGAPCPVTASFGVATLGGPGDDAEVLVAQADAALYRAKNAGRNRVEACATA